ncbi:MAG: glutaredoxin family protein [Planctomycetota bacterium]
MIDLDFLKGQQLEVFSTRTCPDCTRLDQLFAARGVQAKKIYIDSDEAAAKTLEQGAGKRAVPYIRVNGEDWVRGYHIDQPGRLKEALLWDELRAVIEA